MVSEQIEPDPSQPDDGYEQDDEQECGGSAAGSLTDIVIRRRRMPAAAVESMGPMDITAYWNNLRGRRRFPSSAHLDQAHLARNWPNTVLMRCDSDRQLLAMRFSDVQGLLSSSDFSTMAVEWIRSLCMEAAQRGRPVETAEAFPTSNGSVTFRAVALPLSGDERAVDHVLFHVRA